MRPPMAALIVWPFMPITITTPFAPARSISNGDNVFTPEDSPYTVTPEKHAAAPANFIPGASGRMAADSD